MDNITHIEDMIILGPCAREGGICGPDGEDDLKKRQLMELAIMNGTYRDTSKPATATSQPTTPSQAPRFIGPPLTVQQAAQLRTGTPTGAPIIHAPRMPNIATSSAGGLMNGQPPPLVSPTEGGLMYNPYEYPFAYAPATAILEYPSGFEQAAAGAVPKIRRTLAGM